jgi:hypothetical protein
MARIENADALRKLIGSPSEFDQAVAGRYKTDL